LHTEAPYTGFPMKQDVNVRPHFSWMYSKPIHITWYDVCLKLLDREAWKMEYTM